MQTRQTRKKIVNGTTTLYINKYYEKTGSENTIYYYLGGKMVAMRKSSSLSYLYQDHLGSTVATDNGTGVENIKFYPFGGTRSGDVPTDYKFTGQRLDGTGLYYYGARYYYSWLGRFISPDPIIPDYRNPQSLNRYSYVINNPLRYTDPTGRTIVLPPPPPPPYIPPPPPPPGGFPGGGGNGGEGGNGSSTGNYPPTGTNPTNGLPVAPRGPSSPGQPIIPTSPPEPSLPYINMETRLTEQSEDPLQSKGIDVGVNVPVFFVGILFLEVGSTWTFAGLAVMAEVPPAGAAIEIVAAAHYYYGSLCIVNSIQGKGMPDLYDLSLFFRESWNEIKKYIPF